MQSAPVARGYMMQQQCTSSLIRTDNKQPIIAHLAVAADSPIVMTARRLSVTAFPTTPPPSLSTPANMTLSRKKKAWLLQ